MLGRGQLSEIGLYTKNILINELSSNIIDFCPVGALTNKNFALNYRSWDSYYVDSIDFMDSFLNSVRIYHNNLKIKRILANYNTNFDLYWINDKTRYYFDSLKIQRLTVPLILNKLKLFSSFKNDLNLFYITVSWKNISLSLENYINKNSKKFLIKSFLGDFIDLETINVFKSITLKSGLNLLINKSEFSNFTIDYTSLNFDQEINYLPDNNSIEFYNYDLYIFYNYNLRIENPVFNSKLRQKVVWFNLNNLFFFGSNYNLTYKYYHLGNLHNDFVNFLNGKHWLCNFLYKFNNICFCYGNTIFQDIFLKKSWNYYLIKLKNLKIKFLKKKIKFYIYYLTSSITTISSFDLSFFSRYKDKDNFNLNSINYYIGLNHLLRKNYNFKRYNFFNNNFFIYQNSFFDNNFIFCNIMLPVYNCYEVENQFFINCMGLVKQNMKVEVNFEEFIKTNINALKFVFKIISLDKNLNNFSSLENILPIEFFFVTRRLFNFNLLNKYKLFDFCIVKYKNFYFISFNKNFYKSNIYCFYSKQLNIMSNLFFKEKSNFEF